MTMENYSPSHPTDDMDIDDSNESMEKNNEDDNVTKVNNPKELLPETKLKCHVEGVLQKIMSEINEVESSAWTKELSTNKSPSNERDSKSKAPSRISKRSRSKSIDKRSISKAAAKRSRSRSRNRKSRSRSKNRKSRSRSKNRRSRSRSKKRRSRSRSGNRRARSRSRSRSRNRQRSRNRRSRSRSDRKEKGKDNSRQYGRDRDRKKERSPSPPSETIWDKSSQKESTKRSSRSPGARSSLNRSNDNIFNKMTEFQALPLVNDSPKQKWGCDSDEEIVSVASKPAQQSFPDSQDKFSNFDDRSERSFRGRQDFGDRRGRGSARGFQRGGPRAQAREPWQQSSNVSGGDYSDCDMRNKSWTPNRPDNRNERNEWNKPRGQYSPVNVVDNNSTQRWGINNDNGREVGNRQSIQEIDRSQTKMVSSISDNKDGCESEEEFGAWGKKDKADIEIESESRSEWGMGNNSQSNNIVESTNQSWAPRGSQNKAKENTNDGFSSWKSAEPVKPIQSIAADKFAENSDDEFGTWGKKSSSPKILPNESNRPSKAVETKKMTSGDSDDEFGAWGSEQKTTVASTVPSETFDEEEPFNDRSTFNSRNNFNNNNNGQFSQRRGGPRNFNNTNNNINNNRFPRSNNSQDRFFNNNEQSNANYQGNSNNYNNPQFNYNQSQWNMPPYQQQQFPFPIDTSVCPPMLCPPMHQPQPMMHNQMAFVPPPPPSLMNMQQQPMDMFGAQMMLGGHNIPMMHGSMIPSMIPQQQTQQQPAPISIDNNLLETLMTKAGLSSDSLKLAANISNDNKMPSVNDTFTNILKTAATSVISRLVVEGSNKAGQMLLSNDNMSMSPPSPPSTSPPQHHRQSTTAFVPPPMINYNDILRPSINSNKLANLPQSVIHKATSKSSMEVDEEKRNRSDFDSKNEWQERVAMEVKLFLKPAYMSKCIDKHDYKEIMKRCVTKITRSGVAEINTEKIEKFVLSYVEKYNRNRKVKQHSAVSSSEHDLRCD